MNMFKHLKEESERLTFAEETALSEAATEESLTKLVEHNLREALAYTKRVCREAIPDDTLLGLCYTTLMRNAKRFDPAYKRRFFVFAKVGLRGATKRYWKSVDTVRNAHTVSCFEIAENRQAREEAQDGCGLASVDEDDGPWTGLGGSSQPDSEAAALRETWDFVSQTMPKVLSEHEQMVVTLHYQSGFNFQEIGGLLGTCRAAVQLTHSHAIKKMRKAVAGRRLLDQ